MELGAVALVLAETIMRESNAKLTHQSVARDLRDHARGRDAQAEAIPVDDRGLRERKRKNRQAVDQDMLRRNRQAGDRDPHRLVGGAQDIDPIDLDRIDDADRPDNLGVIRQVMVDLFAQLGRELLRIVQLPMPETLRQNRRRRHYRSGERAAPGLINSRDAADA